MLTSDSRSVLFFSRLLSAALLLVAALAAVMFMVPAFARKREELFEEAE